MSEGDSYIYSEIPVGRVIRQLNSMCVKFQRKGETSEAIRAADLSFSVEQAVKFSGIKDESIYPIFDTLPRLWAKGWRTVEQDSDWRLIDESGNVVTTGSTFRGLCVNIVLEGW